MPARSAGRAAPPRLLVDRAGARARLVTPREAARRELLQDLGDRLAQLLEGRGVLDQRHRPALGHQDDQRDRRDLHRLGDLWHGVDVDPAHQEPALELVRQRLQVVRELDALRRAARALEGQQDRRVAELSRSSWKFCSVTRTAYAALVAGPPAPKRQTPAIRTDRPHLVGKMAADSWLHCFRPLVWLHIRPLSDDTDPRGDGRTRRDTVPAVPRTMIWCLLYVFASLLGRIIIVQPNNVESCRPAAGVALVWLASARDRTQLIIDAVLLAALTISVLALTDGTTAQILLLAALGRPAPGRPVAAPPLGTAHLGRRRAGADEPLGDFGRLLAAVAMPRW